MRTRNVSRASDEGTSSTASGTQQQVNRCTPIHKSAAVTGRVHSYHHNHSVFLQTFV